MQRILTALVVAALVGAGCSTDDGSSAGSRAGGAPAEVQAQGAPPDRRAAVEDAVTVVGEGVASGRPDTMRAVLGVEITGDQVEPALSTANERAAAMIDALEGAGVATEDIRTRDVSVRTERPHPGPRPEPGAAPAPDETSIVAVHLLEVRIRDLDRAGEILQAASDAGGDATRIRNVRFELEDDDALLEEGREAAFADAQRKAEHYAELAGRELGPLVSLREQPTGGPPPAVTAPEAGGDRAVPIEPGSELIRVRVRAVWALD